MFDFFSRFFRRDTSSATAKERLRLVLLSDHLALAPETIDALKRELVEVISRYVKIDPQHCDVSFEQQNSTVAMHANIPILGLLSDRPVVAPPVLIEATRPVSELDERDVYLDSLHEETVKATQSNGAQKPEAAQVDADNETRQRPRATAP